MGFIKKKNNLDNLSNWFSSFLFVFGWGRYFLVPHPFNNNLFQDPLHVFCKDVFGVFLSLCVHSYSAGFSPQVTYKPLQLLETNQFAPESSSLELQLGKCYRVNGGSMLVFCKLYAVCAVLVLCCFCSPHPAFLATGLHSDTLVSNEQKSRMPAICSEERE